MTELEAHTRADQIVQHHLSDPLELRSFVARCLLADARLAAQDATIALLRAEVRAWRDWDEHCGVKPLEECECDDVPRGQNLIAARSATDAAGALGGQA